MTDRKCLLRIGVIVVAIFPIIYRIYQLDIVFWASTILVIGGYFLVYFIHRENIKNQTQPTPQSTSIFTALKAILPAIQKTQASEKQKNEIPKETLSVIFAFIAGFAITKALTQFSFGIRDIVTLEMCIRLITFFAVSIPFFHASLSILKNKPNLSNRSLLIFLLFLILFVNAIVIYLQAENLLKFNLFVTFIIILMLINGSWLLIQNYLFRKLGIPNKDPDDLSHEEWLEMHFITSAYLFFVFLPHTVGLDMISEVVLFCVLVARTVFDYRLGWKSVYSSDIQQR